MSSGFRKKVEKFAKQKDCELVGEWCKSMVNHLYWCAMSTESANEVLIKAKWLSLTNHIHNFNRGHSHLFPICSHKRLRAKRKWLKPHKLLFLSVLCHTISDTKASEKLDAIITNKRFVKDVGKLSTLYQT